MKSNLNSISVGLKSGFEKVCLRRNYEGFLFFLRTQVTVSRPILLIMDILQEAAAYGILNVEDVRSQLEKMLSRRKELLTNHPYSVWESKDGKWYTYVVDNTKPNNRRLVKKSSREAIENYICDQGEIVPKADTFDQAYLAFRKVHDRTMSHNSIRRYDTDYERFYKDTRFAETKLSRITKSEVEAFIFEQIRELKLCHSAAKKLYEYTNMVLLYSLEQEWISKNPMQFLSMRDFRPRCYISDRSKKEQTISEEEADALLRQLRATRNYIPAYAVEFAMMTAMRVGEISALRWSDLHENSYILVRCSEKFDRQTNKYYIDDTKNRCERVVPMTDQMVSLLYLVREAEKRAGTICEWVFADENGRIHANVISSCIRNKCKQAGIPYHGIHACRKTINSNMRKSGVGLKAACDILGNTEEVNAKYYSFDLCSVEEKGKMLAGASMVR